jgi:alpha-mannosidase
VPVVEVPYAQPETPIGDMNVPVTADFVVVEDNNVILETLKPSFQNGGFVARFYEASGGWRRTKVSFPLLNSRSWSVVPVNLLEQNVSDGRVTIGEELNLTFHLELDAFELLTVMIERK